MSDLPTKPGPLEMADLKHTSKDKRGRWQYRRHIPEKLRYRFGNKVEFIRALPDNDTERALRYAAAAEEFDAIISGRAAKEASKGIIPRANNRNAPPLSAQAARINSEIAAIEGQWPEIENEPDEDQPLSVAEAIKRFQTDPLRAASEKTKHAHEPRLDTLATLLGKDEPIAGITRADFRKAVEMLHALPREYRRFYADLSPAQAIERAKADKQRPLSEKTRAHYIDTWRSFFRWCENERLIEASPAKAMKPPKVKANKDRKEAWKAPALNALFAAPLFHDPVQRVARPGAFWVPIIGLLQGMRQAEIVLLNKSEIVEAHGVWCFDIRERADRSLKNESSARLIPIHKDLLELGLLDHWRALPDGPLWPDLMMGKSGKPLKDPADQYGKAFLRQVAAAGITSPGHVFHALRHRFASACRAARMPDSSRLYLGGWAQVEGDASRYGDQDMPALKEELDKVCYPGVALPPLG
jgi:integrase